MKSTLLIETNEDIKSLLNLYNPHLQAWEFIYFWENRIYCNDIKDYFNIYYERLEITFHKYDNTMTFTSSELNNLKKVRKALKYFNDYYVDNLQIK